MVPPSFHTCSSSVINPVFKHLPPDTHCQIVLRVMQVSPALLSGLISRCRLCLPLTCSSVSAPVITSAFRPRPRVLPERFWCLSACFPGCLEISPGSLSPCSCSLPQTLPLNTGLIPSLSPAILLTVSSSIKNLTQYPLLLCCIWVLHKHVTPS